MLACAVCNDDHEMSWPFGNRSIGKYEAVHARCLLFGVIVVEIMTPCEILKE